MAQQNKKWLLFLLSACVFLISALYITYPLVFHMGELATGFGDELLISWIQNWVIHALFNNPLSFFDTNLYYPNRNTLAYSDLHFTSSILSIIPLYIIKEPIATFNFTVISSLFLVPFSIFLLSWYLTKNFLASLLSGLLVVFAPVFIDKKVHIQILAVEWIPISVLFFILFHKKKKTRYLILSMLFFLLQTYNSFMPGYFLVFFYSIYVILLFFKERKSLKFILNKRHIGIFLVTIALLIPIVLPYHKISVEYNAKRDIRDAIHLALQPEDLFYANEHTKLQEYLIALPFNQITQHTGFKPGYIGFVFTILSLFVLLYFLKNIKKNNFFISCFVSSALLGLILSLGPALHLGRQTVHLPFPIPLPYALFYYILPGFQGFRNSARFEIMFIIFIAVAIAIVLTQVLKRYSLKTRNLIFLLLIIGVIIEYNFPMEFKHVPQKSEFPAVYHWLDTTPKNSIGIIMPMYDWYMYGAEEEIKRDYYSTANWRKVVNGASGYSTPDWQELAMKLYKEFPSRETIQTIEDLGVNYIIIDKKSYDNAFLAKKHAVSGDFAVAYLKKVKSLRLIKTFENYYVFEFIDK